MAGLGPDFVISPEQMREQTACYVRAVAAAYPKLAALLPDTDGPPTVFDPYPLPATIAQVAAWVAEKHDLSVTALRGAGRNREVVVARQEAFYLCRRRLNKSYSEIGRYFGDRDHTTARYGAWRHAKACGLPVPVERTR